MASSDEIRAAAANPAAPRRGFAGVDRRDLTPEQRARTVVTDPYEGRGRVQDEMVEVEINSRDPRRPGSRLRLRAVTEGQRQDVVRRAELGEIFVVGARPDWFDEYRSGGFRLHDPGVAETLHSDLARQGLLPEQHVRSEDLAASSAARAQKAYAKAHPEVLAGDPAGGDRRLVYRPPVGGSRGA